MGTLSPNKVTVNQLREFQALSLEEKIRFSQVMIVEWYEYWKGLAYVATSGGWDSTILLHLVRSIYPEVPAVFCNTGLEFPENIQFLKTINNLIVLRPKKTFKRVIEQYGYPVVSKRMAQYIYEVRHSNGDTATKRLRLTGVYPNGKLSPMSKISKKWLYLIDAPFSVSMHCCNIMKKNPAKAYSKKTGRMPYIGTRTGEGANREHDYLKYGCNAFDLSSQPRSAPISFWKKEDIQAYTKKFNARYSKIYDKGYERTGCVYCGFGADQEKTPNRYQLLKETHPKLHKYCMEKLGFQEVLDYIGIKTEIKHRQLTLSTFLKSNNSDSEILERLVNNGSA